MPKVFEATHEVRLIARADPASRASCRGRAHEKTNKMLILLAKLRRDYINSADHGGS
jgi:hypothetical protein